jgi:hypothetical protein
MCHKLALIVNAGLAALSLKTLPPSKTKASVLGFFPVLGRLPEEEEPEDTQLVQAPGLEVEVIAGLTQEDIESGSDYGNADDEGSDNGSADDGCSDAEDNLLNNSSSATQGVHLKTSRLLDLTEKVSPIEVSF